MKRRHATNGENGWAPRVRIIVNCSVSVAAVALAACASPTAPATEEQAQRPGVTLTGAAIPAPLNGQPAGEKPSDRRNRPPRPMKVVNAEYPARLVKAGITGRVVVEFYVTSKGDVVQPRAIESPDPELSRLAEESLLKWKFTPAVKDGKAVAVKLSIPVEFSAPKTNTKQDPDTTASGR